MLNIHSIAGLAQISGVKDTARPEHRGKQTWGLPF